MELTDVQLTEPLSVSYDQVFEQAFKTHFRGLHAYAYTILKDDALAEETVQQVFYKIWERKERLAIESSVKAYLYRAVYNESLNHLKHRKVKATYQAHVMRTNNSSEQGSRKIQAKELEERLRKAMNELPEQCRTVFQLSRFEGLKYQEIASQLHISVKTVENQMGKALKVLRSKLVEFLPIIIAMLFHN